MMSVSRVLAPFCSSGLDVAEDALSIAGVNSGDIVFDLGCGDGDVLIASASRFKAFTIGVEINRKLCRRAWVRVKEYGLQHLAQVVCGDLIYFPISRANVIYMYLTSEAYSLLKDKIRFECKPGTRIVTHTIPIPDWEADEIVHRWCSDKPYTIYLYRVKGSRGLKGVLDLDFDLEFNVETLRLSLNIIGGNFMEVLNKVLN